MNLIRPQTLKKLSRFTSNLLYLFLFFGSLSFGQATKFFISNNSNVIVHQASLTTLSDDYKPTSLNNNDILVQIEKVLTKIHETAKASFEKIEKTFPTNDNEFKAKDLLYLLVNVTDKNFSINGTNFFNNLLQNFLSIIQKGILVNSFPKEDSAEYKKLKQKFFIPVFKPTDFSSSTDGVSFEWKSNSVLNTLTENEKKEAISFFLNKISQLSDLKFNNLNKFSDSTYSNWFENIPLSERPTRSPFENLNFVQFENFVKQISFSKNNSNKVFSNVYKLQDEVYKQKVIAPIVANFQKDAEKLKQAVENSNSDLFVDNTPVTFAQIFSDDSDESFALSKVVSLWNLVYSKPSYISLSKSTKDNQLELLELSINNNSSNWDIPSETTLDEANIKNDKWKSSLNLKSKIMFNNASFSEKKVEDGNSYFKYNSNPFSFLNYFIENFGNRIQSNLNSLIKLKSDSQKKITNLVLQKKLFELEKNDFTINERVENLKKLFDLNFEVNPEKISADNFSSIFSGKIPINVNFQFKVLINNKNYSFKKNYSTFYLLNSNIFDKNFIELLKLFPIYKNPDINNNPTISEIVKNVNESANKQQSKYFSYLNKNSNISYHPIKAQILTNGDVKITTKITGSLFTNSKGFEYDTVLRKEIFEVNNDLKKQAWNKSVEINNKVKLQIGKNLYNKYYTDEIHQQLFDESWYQTLSNDKYHAWSKNQKLNEFSKIYLNKINNFFKKIDFADNSEIKFKIDQYYDSLDNKLEDFINKNGIDSNSELAKNWKQTIDNSRNNSKKNLINFGNIDDPNLNNLLQILNDKNVENRFQNLIKLFQNFNPNSIIKNASLGQKILISTMVGITGLTLIGASFFFYRIFKVNKIKFSIKKSVFLGFSGFIIFASAAVLIYFAVFLSGGLL